MHESIYSILITSGGGCKHKIASCNRGEAEAVPCQKKGRTGGGAPGRQKVERRSILPLNLVISQPGHVDHERNSTPIHSVFVN
eukprot:scaffold39185_cov65-Cyclotella_meneghiniana.AAC.3